MFSNGPKDCAFYSFKRFRIFCPDEGFYIVETQEFISN